MIISHAPIVGCNKQRALHLYIERLRPKQIGVMRFAYYTLRLQFIDSRLHRLLPQAVNRRFRPPDELGVGLAQPQTTPTRPIDAKPRLKKARQGAATTRVALPSQRSNTTRLKTLTAIFQTARLHGQSVLTTAGVYPPKPNQT